MVFLGGDNEGGNDNSGYSKEVEVDQQRAAQEEAARVAKEEQERQEQEELLKEQERADRQEEADKNRSAHDATDQADQELQQGKAGNTRDLDAMVQGNVGNLGGDLQGIIDELAKSAINVQESQGSTKTAGIKGLARQDGGSGKSGPDGNDDGNDSSKGDQGASR